MDDDGSSDASVDGFGVDDSDDDWFGVDDSDDSYADPDVRDVDEARREIARLLRASKSRRKAARARHISQNRTTAHSALDGRKKLIGDRIAVIDGLLSALAETT